MTKLKVAIIAICELILFGCSEPNVSDSQGMISMEFTKDKPQEFMSGIYGSKIQPDTINCYIAPNECICAVKSNFMKDYTDSLFFGVFGLDNRKFNLLDYKCINNQVYDVNYKMYLQFEGRNHNTDLPTDTAYIGIPSNSDILENTEVFYKPINAGDLEFKKCELNLFSMPSWLGEMQHSIKRYLNIDIVSYRFFKGIPNYVYIFASRLPIRAETKLVSVPIPNEAEPYEIYSRTLDDKVKLNYLIHVRLGFMRKDYYLVFYNDQLLPYMSKGGYRWLI